MSRVFLIYDYLRSNLQTHESSGWQGRGAVVTTSTLIVRHDVQVYGVWRAVCETLEGFLEQHGRSDAVGAPHRNRVRGLW
jgi:hypothetical protein